jgi:hypothetical protein
MTQGEYEDRIRDEISQHVLCSAMVSLIYTKGVGGAEDVV